MRSLQRLRKQNAKRVFAMSRRPENAGTIYRRKDGMWVASISAGRDGEGTRVRKTEYAYSRQEATKKLNRLRILANPVSGLTPDITLNEYYSRWLEFMIKPKAAPGTIDLFRTSYRLYIKRQIGHIPLNKFTQLNVQLYYSQLAAKKVSVCARRSIHTALHLAFAHGVKWGLLHKNPCEGVVKPKLAPTKITLLTPDEIKRFLQEASNSRMFALFVMAITTGMRRGELFGLKWDDFDFQSATVSLQRGVADVRGHVFVGDLKRHASKRTIHLPKFTLAALRQHRERMRAEGLVSEFVFITKRGGLLRGTNLHMGYFQPLIKAAQLPAIRFHDLRHLHATTLLALKVNPKIVAERLGHASAEVTLNVYSHLVPGLQDGAVQILQNLFTTVLSDAE